MADYKSLLSERLASVVDQSNEHVIDALAAREVQKRADAIVKVIDMLEADTRKMHSLRPDNVTFNADGTKASETFSKTKLDELVKAKERVAKLEKALNDAFGGKMDHVYNLVNQAKG